MWIDLGNNRRVWVEMGNRQGVGKPTPLFLGREFSISIQKLSNTKRGGSLTPKRPEILLYHAPPNLSRVF